MSQKQIVNYDSLGSLMYMLDDGQLNIYIRLNVYRKVDLDRLNKRINQKNVLTWNIPDLFGNNYKQYLLDLYEFELKSSYSYREETQKKSIFANEIVLLIPKQIQSSNKKKELVRRFISSLTGDTPLHYIVFEKKKGKGTYLHILCSERGYAGIKRKKVYKKDCFISSVTKNTCKSNDEHAVLHIKKGTEMKDKDGNPIYEDVTFTDKNRVLSFSKKQFPHICENLRTIFTNVLLLLVKKIGHGLSFKTKKVEPWWYKDKRKKMIAFNLTVKYIQSKLNYSLQKIRDQQDIVAHTWSELKEYSYWTQEEQQKLKQVKALFYKYKARVEVKAFTDQEKNKCSIDPLSKAKGSYEMLYNNLEKLKTQFDLDLAEVFNQDEVIKEIV